MADSGCDLIGALEREWRDALCAKDWDKLRRMTHPEFRLIGTRSTGPFVMTREEWLDAIQKRDLVSIEVHIADAVILDHVMVGTVEAKWCIRYMNREIEDCVILTDVWVRSEGEWQVVRRHSTPRPSEPRSRG